MGDLKPCPFCGGNALIWSVPEWNTYEVRCNKCAAVADDASTKDRAADQWNRRTTQPEVTALVDAMRCIVFDVDAGNAAVIDTVMHRIRMAISKWEAHNEQ